MKINFRLIAFVSILCLMAVLIGSLGLRAAVRSQRQQIAKPGLSNFDIRSSETKDAHLKLDAHRQKLTSQQRTRQAQVKREIVEAKESLQNGAASGEILLSPLTGAPEIVSTSLASGRFLTAPSSQERDQIVRDFLRSNTRLFGLTPEQIGQLEVSADYMNPEGNLAWVTLEQKFNDIPVFAGQLRAGLSPNGQLVRTVSTLASGVREEMLQTAAAISAEQAVAIAASSLGITLDPIALTRKSTSPDGHKVIFAGGPFAQDIQVELVYFPLEVGLVNLSWSMVLWQDVPAYYTVVDAEKGDLVFRKNITNEQTQNVSYSVYNDDSPSPLTPSNILPGPGTQPPSISRTLLTLISELPAFDNLGWITDGGNVTTGNNVDAGLDLSAPNGIDAAGRATGSPNRVFDFPYNPPPGGTDVPSGANYRMGVVTDLFFWSNRYHDQMYQYGFTEPAGNFQANNFGRGGIGGDFVRAEAQDSSGTDNANFSTPPDGQLPRMQMYLFTGPTIDRDGSLDHEVVLHELTHGLSNRLHANASGLNSDMSGGMGEGWSDFYARALLSTASEDVNGIYASGAYASLNIDPGFVDNYYYGIRRFPYAVKTNLGTNGKPHNPLTFADIDPTKIDLTDGAFAPAFTGIAEEVHNVGEVWCMALLEVRARIITRLGFAAGNARTLQIVTDGMKLDPVNPTLLDARNAIILADRAGFNGDDEADIWAGFAARGMGFSAKINGGVNVTESFDLPNLALGSVTFSDSSCNNNGFADPGETLALSVPISNSAFNTNATSVTASVTGGGTGNYGTINAGATGTQSISFDVPANAVCGSLLTISVDINSSFGAVTRTFQIVIGQPVTTYTENFDSVTAPILPAGWTTSATGGGTSWVTSTTTPDTAPNDAFTPNASSTGSSTLTSPSIPITISGARLSFRHRYDFEEGFDGGAVEIKIGAGSFTDILNAGGSFISNGYNEVLPFSVTGCTHGLPRHNAWTGNSGGYVTTVIQLPAAAAGQNIQLRWIAGADCSAAGTGWRIDTISISGNAICAGSACAGNGGFQFYPLAVPVRLLDTRVGALNSCTTPGAPIAGNTSLLQSVRGTCGIPAAAKAVTGNVTVVTPGANGFLTIYPSDATQPGVANTNFVAGDVLNNVFTVGLGSTDGAMKIFASTTAEVVVDITGYYAPPDTGGLYFHPLPKPIRLLETRVTQPGCFTPGTPLVGNTDTIQQGTTMCDGVTIPATAKALVGNATVVGPAANGFLTLYPADAASRPLAASGNYRLGTNLNSPFTVGLSPSGQFKIYTVANTDLVIDVLGYYSAHATDTNGTGLRFNPLTPARLLDTRTGATGACYLPGAALTGGVESLQSGRTTCTIPNIAQALVGNATTVLPASNGFLTFWPSNVVTRPTAATANYQSGRNFNRHFIVGLGTDGAFKMYASANLNLVVDVSGYFAP
ncbi:MAG TPA: M36 family metallopeptidase [Blastocatellia bacterium]|nr:M36 family metallopeptidase [Blastocatellia bacterium]